MDRDEFARCTRLGRKVAEGITDALEGRPWTSFLPNRLLENLVQVAGGIPTAREILEVIEGLHSAPGLPGFFEDAALTQLDAISRASGANKLDIVLADVAKRGVLRRWSPTQVAEEFFFALLSRHALEGRGGLLETRTASWYSSHLSEIRLLLLPVVQKAAQQLLSRPEARALGLSRVDRISADDDLRGTAAP